MSGTEAEAINALVTPNPAPVVAETPPGDPPAEPPATPEPEPAGDEAADEMSVEEFEALIDQRVEERLAARAKPAAGDTPAEDPDFEDAPAWAKKLNKRLDDVTQYTASQTQAALAEREQRVQGEIDACAEKYKMSQAEVDAAAHYLLASGRASTMKFEEGALALLPHIKARGPKPAPAPASPGGKGAAPTNPIANGGTSAALPKEYVPSKTDTPETVLEHMRSDGSLNLLVKQ
jgi:hypothetical protein